MKVIGRSLRISHNHRLVSITGAEVEIRTSQWAGDLNFKGRKHRVATALWSPASNPKYSTLRTVHQRPGFPALVRIGWDFSLRGNSKLLAAPAMPSLRAIDGNVEVIFNPAMQTVDDMAMALETVQGSFLIKELGNTDVHGNIGQECPRCVVCSPFW